MKLRGGGTQEETIRSHSSSWGGVHVVFTFSLMVALEGKKESSDVFSQMFDLMTTSVHRDSYLWRLESQQLQALCRDTFHFLPQQSKKGHNMILIKSKWCLIVTNKWLSSDVKPDSVTRMIEIWGLVRLLVGWSWHGTCETDSSICPLSK